MDSNSNFEIDENRLVVSFWILFFVCLIAFGMKDCAERTPLPVVGSPEPVISSRDTAFVFGQSYQLIHVEVK